MFMLLVLGIVTDVGSGGHELQHSQAMGFTSASGTCPLCAGVIAQWLGICCAYS